jgi:hypothetical protein
MNTVKSLAIVALLLGGTSLAMAQNGPATGGQPPAATPAPPGPGVIPHDVQSTAPSPNLQAAAPVTGASSGTRIAQQTTKKKMYMSAKGIHHKASLKNNSRLQTMPSGKQ